MRELGATVIHGADGSVKLEDPERNEFRLVVGRTRKPALPRLTLEEPVQVRVRAADNSVLTVGVPAGALRGLQALGDAMLAALSQGDEGARGVAPPRTCNRRPRNWTR